MSVSQQTRLTLWTRSAGHCQFENCNHALLGDLLTGQDELNNGYVAHIVADSPGGPRGDPVLSEKLSDDVANLMLLCNGHHRLIDAKKTRDLFPVARLLAMKAAHERRIELVTEIMPDRASHVLLFGARIGEHDCPTRYDLAKTAMLPDRYPADRQPISLDITRSDFADHEPAYWQLQLETLRRQFSRKVRDQVADGGIKHLSLFALAPQPLLMELGRLLSDIAAVNVHQLHREPQGWDWRDARPPIEITVLGSNREGTEVGLILDLSATITIERAQAVLGPDAPVWRVTTPEPGNDVMHRREDLEAFRKAMRRAFDAIKAQHGQDARVHIFPALPVSAAVEVGRTWMPKADLPLVIYDENRARGGFEQRLTIGESRPVQKELTNA